MNKNESAIDSSNEKDQSDRTKPSSTSQAGILSSLHSRQSNQSPPLRLNSVNNLVKGDDNLVIGVNYADKQELTLRNCKIYFTESGLFFPAGSRNFAKAKIVFKYKGTANSVHVAGSFNHWLHAHNGKIQIHDQSWSMAKSEDQTWSLTMELPPGQYAYKYVIDQGKEWLTDPQCLEHDRDGNCVLRIEESQDTSNQIYGEILGKNRKFVDKDGSSIAKIYAYLRSNDSGMVLLFGLPGAGKTQIANAYLYEHCQDYDRVFWFQSDGDNLIDQFRSIYLTLEDDDKAKFDNSDEGNGENGAKYIKYVHLYLAQHYKKVLFIFDNIKNYAAVRPYLPRQMSVKGHVSHCIFTSRLENGWSDEVKKFEVSYFTIDEAEKYIIRELDNTDGPATVDRAKLLARELHYYPLLIAQVVATIKRQNGTINTIKKFLDNRETNREYVIGQNNLPVDEFKTSVLAAWMTVRNDLERTNPLALVILELCSFLYSDDINETIFSGYSQADLMSAFDELFSRMLLLRVDRQSRSFRVHKETQEVVRLWQGSNQLQRFTKVVELMEALNKKGKYPFFCQRIDGMICLSPISKWSSMHHFHEVVLHGERLGLASITFSRMVLKLFNHKFFISHDYDAALKCVNFLKHIFKLNYPNELSIALDFLHATVLFVSDKEQSSKKRKIFSSGFLEMEDCSECPKDAYEKYFHNITGLMEKIGASVGTHVLWPFETNDKLAAEIGLPIDKQAKSNDLEVLTNALIVSESINLGDKYQLGPGVILIGKSINIGNSRCAFRSTSGVFICGESVNIGDSSQKLGLVSETFIAARQLNIGVKSWLVAGITLSVDSFNIAGNLNFLVHPRSKFFLNQPNSAISEKLTSFCLFIQQEAESNENNIEKLRRLIDVFGGGYSKNKLQISKSINIGSLFRNIATYGIMIADKSTSQDTVNEMDGLDEYIYNDDSAKDYFDHDGNIRPHEFLIGIEPLPNESTQNETIAQLGDVVPTVASPNKTEVSGTLSLLWNPAIPGALSPVPERSRDYPSMQTSSNPGNN